MWTMKKAVLVACVSLLCLLVIYYVCVREESSAGGGDHAHAAAHGQGDPNLWAAKRPKSYGGDASPGGRRGGGVGGANSPGMDDLIALALNDWRSAGGREGGVPPGEGPANSWEGDVESHLARQRSLEYCNPPDDHIAAEEGAVPEDFTLESVHVLIRHGDRSPFYKLPNQQSPRLSCTVNVSESGRHRTLLAGYMEYMGGPGQSIPHSRRLGLAPRTDPCMGAQLTGKGLIQHLAGGAALRQIYVDQLGLLPEARPDPALIYFRTTDYSRTFQSGLAFLYGLLPNLDFSRLAVHMTNEISFCLKETSGVSCHCPAAHRQKDVANKEAQQLHDNATTRLLGQVKKELAEVFGVDKGKIPWIGAIIEVLMGYVCHDLPLPCRDTNRNLDNAAGDDHCVTWPMVQRMWRYLDEHGRAVVNGYANQKYARIITHPLRREIAQRMLNLSQHPERTDHPRLILYSGHDLTVSSLAKAFGIHDGHWPPYGSRIVMELYSTNHRAQYFIRVLFNGRDKTGQLRFCPESDLVHGLCPLDNYVYHVLYKDLEYFNKSTFAEVCS